MRSYTKPLINKSHILFKILNAIKMGRPFFITPKEKMLIESLHGLDLILRNIKESYCIVTIPAHNRINGHVRAHKRRTGKRYYFDIGGLLRQGGVDYLIGCIQNQINNLRSMELF